MHVLSLTIIELNDFLVFIMINVLIIQKNCSLIYTLWLMLNLTAANLHWNCLEFKSNNDIVLKIQVYAVHFKCNKKLLREYPNLFNYTKDIYQIPGMSSTVHMEHIKKHYYGSHPSINPFGIIPSGPNIDYTIPHDREKFSN